MDRDHYLCLLCLEEGRLTWDGLEVHHITPIEEDYEQRLEEGELITLCIRHHKAAEAGGISRERLRAAVRRSMEGGWTLPGTPRGDEGRGNRCAQDHKAPSKRDEI